MSSSHEHDLLTERRQYKEASALFVFRLISSIGITALSYAARSKIVEGDVLKMEGEYYTVHDTAGRRSRLHVDKTMHLEGALSKPPSVMVKLKGE